MPRWVFVFAALLLIPCSAMAQDSASPRQADAASPRQTDAASPRQTDTSSPPQVDLLDLWRAIRHKPPQTDEEPQGRMIAAVPVISRNPTFGLQFGFAAQVAFVAGDPATTRISSSVNSLTFSTQGQTFVNVKFNVYTADSTWMIEGDNRAYRAGEAIYGLGTSTPSTAALDANYSFLRFHDTALRRARGPLYLGGGLLFDSHSHIRPASVTEEEWNAGSFITYSQQHGLPTGSQQSAGLSANVLVDRRVGEIDPRSGWMAQGWYRVSFSGFLSGDSSWQLAHLEYRAYVPLGAHAPAPVSGKAGVPAKHRLTFWTFTDLVTTGAPPYFELPSTVADVYGRSSRAYQQGRYRGEKLIYGEVEYRGMLMRNGLLGMVVFANAATLTNLSTGERLFDSVAPAAGAGLRVLFNKRSRTNLCVDGAFGKNGAKGLYLAIQDAF